VAVEPSSLVMRSTGGRTTVGGAVRLYAALLSNAALRLDMRLDIEDIDGVCCTRGLGGELPSSAASVISSSFFAVPAEVPAWRGNAAARDVSLSASASEISRRASYGEYFSTTV